MALDQDYYSVLGVPREASPRQIKLRFLELARDRHPDRFQGAEKDRAETEFQAITEAFNLLSDPVKRRQIDLALARPKSAARHDPSDVLRVYLNRGIRAYKAGNYLEAANNFDRASQTDPSSAQAWHHLALTSMKETRWLEKAQQAIERAIELRPSHVPYLKLAGRIFADSRMTAKARQYYNQALKAGGDDAGIRGALSALGGSSTASAGSDQSGSSTRSGDPNRRTPSR